MRPTSVPSQSEANVPLTASGAFSTCLPVPPRQSATSGRVIQGGCGMTEAGVSSQPVLLERLENGVLTLTLNRPERLNALNDALHEALADGMARAAASEACRVVLITGAGKGFCAGADLADRTLAPGQARPDLGEFARQALQSADPRHAQPTETGGLCSQRAGGGRRRQFRARLRRRARREIRQISAGLRPRRARARRRRHLDPAAARRATRGPAR